MPRSSVPQSELESAYKQAAIIRRGLPNGQEVADVLTENGTSITMHTVYRRFARYGSPDDDMDKSQVSKQVADTLSVYPAVVVDGIVHTDAPSFTLDEADASYTLALNTLHELPTDELQVLGQAVLGILSQRAQNQ